MKKLFLLCSLFFLSITTSVFGKSLNAKYSCVAYDLVGIEHSPNKKTGNFLLTNNANHFEISVFKEDEKREGLDQFSLWGLGSTELWISDSNHLNHSFSPLGGWKLINGYFQLIQLSKNKVRFIYLNHKLVGKHWSTSNVYLYDGECKKIK